jgi:hypothetical protein
MATRFEIISQMVVRSIASDKNIEVLRIGLLKPNLACHRLVMRPKDVKLNEGVNQNSLGCL